MKCILAFLLAAFSVGAAAQTPRIVNIVNFIRLLEPRDSSITEDVLYQTVVQQVALMRKYHLPGTFLLQYDALLDRRYQELLRSLPRDSFEIGAWWEIPQPLVENSDLHWRGRYPWDWRANIGFSTGYTPREREKLIDTYMAGFYKIFGYYPATVGSWFIDAHSLAYMYTHYHIVASCNCKDQYGTDGYTLWGGYWNQAYYPSKVNAYMPAQDKAFEIPVPIFRMLGSDPIRQYDNGLGSSRQGVITLEPVYPFGGGDSTWVQWFFHSLVRDPDLGFNYTQAGQENSFTWAAMARGLSLQFPLIARLRDSGLLRVETLGASGRWFSSKYAVTPATTFSVSDDLPGSDLRTLWYDSRFYRINLLWEHGTLRIRDIHLFDEHLASPYETTPVTLNECRFLTLPFVDGYVWSKPGVLAGIRIMSNGVPVLGGEPVFTPVNDSVMRVRWPLTSGSGTMEIVLYPSHIEISMAGKWYLEMTAAHGAVLPFVSIRDSAVVCEFDGMHYRVSVEGRVVRGDIFRIIPKGDIIKLNFNSLPLPTSMRQQRQ